MIILALFFAIWRWLCRPPSPPKADPDEETIAEQLDFARWELQMSQDDRP